MTQRIVGEGGFDVDQVLREVCVGLEGDDITVRYLIRNTGDRVGRHGWKKRRYISRLRVKRGTGVLRPQEVLLAEAETEAPADMDEADTEPEGEATELAPDSEADSLT